jgi:AsmA protein
MRKALISVGIAIAVLIVIVLTIPLFVDANQFRPTIESHLQEALGRKVTIGNLHLSIFSGGVTADNISIAEDPAYGQEPFLKAKSLDVGVDLLPLIFSHRVHASSIALHDPEVRLIRGNGSKWNFSSLGAQQGSSSAQRNPAAAAARSSSAKSSGSEEFSIDNFRISNGRLIVSSTAAPQRTHEYQNVQVRAKNISTAGIMPFSVVAGTPGGGSIKVDGKAGPLNQTDAATTPLNAAVIVKQLDLAATGFTDPASGIAGVVDYEGTVKSNGKQAHTEGKATANKLKLVRAGAPARQPVTFDYAADYDLERQAGALSQGDIHTGKTSARLTGNYGAQGPETVVHMKLNGNNMPVGEVEGLLPAFGVVLPPGASLQGGTVTANLSIDGPVNNLVITGPLNVSNTRLAGFNLGQKLSAVAALAGVRTGNDTDIQTLSSVLKIAPAGIQAESLNLVVPALGSVTGNGTIGANNALDFKMLAKLANGGGLLGGLSTFSSLGHSGGQIPFRIQGTTANPIFIPDVGKALQNTVTAPGQTVGGFLGLFKKKKQSP